MFVAGMIAIDIIQKFFGFVDFIKLYNKIFVSIIEVSSVCSNAC